MGERKSKAKLERKKTKKKQTKKKSVRPMKREFAAKEIEVVVFDELDGHGIDRPGGILCDAYVAAELILQARAERDEALSLRDKTFDAHDALRERIKYFVSKCVDMEEQRDEALGREKLSVAAYDLQCEARFRAGKERDAALARVKALEYSLDRFTNPQAVTEKNR